MKKFEKFDAIYPMMGCLFAAIVLIAAFAAKLIN